MWTYFYKKFVIDFPKITLFLIAILICFSFYNARNFNLDASSDALLLEGDKDLKYLREVNERYGSKDFLFLTYAPVSSFEEKGTILNLQLLKFLKVEVIHIILKNLVKILNLSMRVIMLIHFLCCQLLKILI